MNKKVESDYQNEKRGILGIQGFIVKSNKGFFEVYLREEQLVVTAKTRGVLRHRNFDPVVGDHVTVSLEDDGYIITAVADRLNELIRPKIANIDYAIVLISVKEPEIQSYLLDKYLSVLAYNEIKPIIILSKTDLLTDTEKQEIATIQAYYEWVGYPVFTTSKGVVNQKEQLFTLLTGKITTVMGQTGVGKSTFLNNLTESLALETAEISHALGRGKHTTRIVELYQIGAVWIADTPGFSSFQSNLDDERLVSDTFIEFHQFPCKFQDCAHQAEIKCGVKQAVSDGKILQKRYESFVKLYQEVKAKKPMY